MPTDALLRTGSGGFVVFFANNACNGMSSNMDLDSKGITLYPQHPAPNTQHPTPNTLIPQTSKLQNSNDLSRPYLPQNSFFGNLTILSNLISHQTRQNSSIYSIFIEITLLAIVRILNLPIYLE
ncbi:hypothetical protein HUB98_15215 [Paenibacillus barcinonensis]|uniref:Uncharacterized protein n=1 Tax=Paenibacillus barcinonensis TaxID=198119 RepID=A0ABX6Q5P5_PAEBA|nr:hypothetical protein [Paenibacillus barcinonensis]QKS57523.1 hypothetical protein HUB98_15215 [Paenibacillus barcinonensis]